MSWLSEWTSICPTVLRRGSGMICQSAAKKVYPGQEMDKMRSRRSYKPEAYHWVMHTFSKTEKLAPGAKLGGMVVDSCFQRWVSKSNVGWTARSGPSLQPWTWVAIVWMWRTRVQEQACWLWHRSWLIESAFILHCWGGWDFRVCSSPFQCASLRALIFYPEGY